MDNLVYTHFDSPYQLSVISYLVDCLYFQIPAPAEVSNNFKSQWNTGLLHLNNLEIRILHKSLISEKYVGKLITHKI